MFYNKQHKNFFLACICHCYTCFVRELH